MSPVSRNVVKWAMLAIAVVAVVVAAPPEEAGVAKTVRSTVMVQGAVAAPVRAKQGAGEQDRMDMDRLVSMLPSSAVTAASGVEVVNVFGSTSWYVPPPPPPPPPPAPPPVPTAPPLPFTYLGRYEDAPTQLTILLKGERMYTVARGDVIEDIYRVDQVTPGMVELTYLPLNIKQTLRTGETL